MARSYFYEEWADLVESVRQGKSQLWSSDRAAAITEIMRRQDGGKTLVVTYAGGELAGILDMQASAAAWGRAQGCDKMMVTGRKGWARALRGEGYRQTQCVLERDI